MINCLKTVFISHSNADKLTKHKQYLNCLYHRPIQQQTKTFMAEQRTGKATLLHLLFQSRKKTFPFLILLFNITQQPLKLSLSAPQYSRWNEKNLCQHQYCTSFYIIIAIYRQNTINFYIKQRIFIWHVFNSIFSYQIKAKFVPHERKCLSSLCGNWHLTFIVIKGLQQLCV